MKCEYNYICMYVCVYDSCVCVCVCVINEEMVIAGVFVYMLTFIRGAIQNYVDFCCRIFILQPITSCFSQNKVLS